MTENSIVHADKIVKGLVNPEDFTTPYMMLRDRRPGRLVNAINLMAKYGWRPVAAYHSYIIMERT